MSLWNKCLLICEPRWIIACKEDSAWHTFINKKVVRLPVFVEFTNSTKQEASARVLKSYHHYINSAILIYLISQEIRT